MTRRARTCPTCHRPFSSKLIVHGPVRQRIVDLIGNLLDGITQPDLIDLVYADDIDDRPNKPNEVSVTIKKAHEELAARVTASRRRGLGVARATG
jgi:hypothetical protein